MAANKVELQEAILKAVDAVVTQRNNELQLDKTITGVIKKNIGKRGGKTLYQVQYSGGIIEAVTQNADDIYSPYTGVYVLIPQGNFSNEKIIIGRSANISTDRSASVVAAAVNNYSIVGANLLTSNTDEDIKTKQFGLRSFHPEFRDNVEDEGINHRAQFLYRFDNNENPIDFQHNKINIYKDEATAIMIKADFLTNLHTVQKNQSSARYGLIFNFAFDNLNKGYGETNGEILDNISKIIDGKIESENDQGYSKQNLYRNVISSSGYFGSRILSSNNNDINLWITDNRGILDQTIELTKTLYQCFKVDNAKLDKEIIANTIQGFINLLEELKHKDSVSEIKNEYEQWRNTIVGDDAQKYIQFVLSSDDMIGNPFSFDKWSTQYAVFNIDLETFNHLDSILFYKEGFFVDTENTDYEHQWPIGTVPNGGEDIFVRNLQMYAMNPLDNQSGDYTLNVEPYNGLDAIISSENPKTCFKATLLRKFYENLTANGKTSFFWFKEDPSVINSNSANYNYLGGIGWKKLEHNETNYLFTTTISDNHAYKNNYKCVAVYEPSSDDKTVLSFIFAVYNEDMNTDIRLESDLGVRFSFDAGAPIVKVLINEDRVNNPENFEEKYYAEDDEYPRYIYSWTIDDAANGYTLFLDEINTVLTEESNSIQDAYLLSSKQGLLKRIKAYIKDNPTTKISYATRIKYPVAISSSGFTITCYVKQLGDNGVYYDIGSASLEFENQNESIATGYRIHIINGDQVFQYDEYGNTPCSDKKKNPIEVKPLQAKLFTPSGLEVEGTNYQVEWILPIEATMITTPEVLTLNPSTGLEQSFVGSELSFSIAKLYDPSAYANQITCHIRFGETDYYKDTNFYFGKQGGNGTNGTDTVAKINCTLSDTTNVLHYQPLTLYLQKSEDEPTKGMWNIGPRELKEEIELATVKYTGEGEKQSGPLKLSVYQKETELSSEDFKTGYPKWNLAGNISERENNTGTIFSLITDTEQQSLIWNGKNTNNKYRLQNIRASVQLKDDQMYYAFFSLPIIEYESGTNLENLISSNRISIDKDFYLNEIVYNADGRNPIYNHNQGLRLYNIPANINKIKWFAKGGLVESRLVEGKLVEGENEPWILLLDEKGSDNGTKDIITIPQDNASMIYVLPKDIFDGSATNNRIEAKLYNNETLIATVYAPINMTLNTFGLTSLNAWDGNTVTIDEEGGYVMAPQVGAGEKDDNNRFTGILMGKTETYTGGGDNQKQIGLFGYKDGLQSIFLDAETGNAFFGLPDVVDIEEDGTTSKKYKNTNRDANDDYNEGRIELKPGGVSTIGGWRLGRRSLYYTDTNTIGDHYENDYIPEKNTGKIISVFNGPYSGHHEKDIKHDDSGILIHSGKSPYFSIKGPVLAEGDIEDADRGTYLREGDSLEIQLDPKAPTLFTVFRHNGPRWEKTVPSETGGEPQIKKIYNENTRTYLAGINGKGEFVANSVSSIVQLNSDDDSAYATSFSVNSFRAFNDIKDDNGIENPQHTGLRMKIGEHILGQMFISNSGLNVKDSEDENHDPTLYITGGLTNSGEYSRPISLNGKRISLFAEDPESQQNFFETTTANLQLKKDSFETNVGNATFKLFRAHDNENPSNLMSANNLKINAGLESEEQEIEYYTYYINKDTDNTAKINKRNVSNLYVTWKEGTDQKYFQYGSWIGQRIYLEDPNPDKSGFYIEKDNYPRCYRIKNNNNNITSEYCTIEDFMNKYYRIRNYSILTTKNIEEYISEDFLLQNRFKKENNNYSRIESSTEPAVGQFLGIEKTLNEEVLDQSYFYIEITKLEPESSRKQYAKYGNQYVYIKNTTIYCRLKKNNNYSYIPRSTIDAKSKIAYEGNYYNEEDISLDFTYYKYDDQSSILYLPSNIFTNENRYVKILREVIVDEETGTTEIEEIYIPYETVEEDVTEELYFFWRGIYYKLEYVDQNIEYVADENLTQYFVKNNLRFNIYLINGNEYEGYRAFSDIYNDLYYEVRDKEDVITYLSEADYQSLVFDYYYYGSTIINGSNYILSSNIIQDSKYKYEDNLYILDNNTGTYYKTDILNPNKGTYEYIPLTKTSSEGPYIIANNKYYYNSLLKEWKLYEETYKLLTSEKRKDLEYYSYNETEPFWTYYLKDNTWKIKELSDLTYYYIQDINNEFYYIETTYLDEYINNHPLYLYINGFKEIKTSEQSKTLEASSTKKYELYAGNYFGKITTNETYNKYISLEANADGINFFNSSGPINLISENPIFNLKIRKSRNGLETIGGELSFGSSAAMFKNENMLGKFIIDDAEDGLILTNTWLRLKSKAHTLIESPNSINLTSANQGSGALYTASNPQIVFRAGADSRVVPGANTAKNGTKVELILNSSNNGWASTEGIVGRNWAKKLSYPIFKIGTSYSSIGIYPEVFSGNYYRENFYVAMPQYNSMGLSVQGHIPSADSDYGLQVEKGGYFGGIIKTNKGFYGNGKNISYTCHENSSSAQPNCGTETTLGTTIIISNVPSITVSSNKRPKITAKDISFKYKMPTASDILWGEISVATALSSRPTTSTVSSMIAKELTSVWNAINAKADKKHRHTIKYTKRTLVGKEGAVNPAAVTGVGDGGISVGYTEY